MPRNLQISGTVYSPTQVLWWNPRALIRRTLRSRSNRQPRQPHRGAGVELYRWRICCRNCIRSWGRREGLREPTRPGDLGDRVQRGMGGLPRRRGPGRHGSSQAASCATIASRICCSDVSARWRISFWICSTAPSTPGGRICSRMNCVVRAITSWDCVQPALEIHSTGIWVGSPSLTPSVSTKT